MIELFDIPNINPTNVICHSGGAVGSDTYWDIIGSEFGIKTQAYSYKTKSHVSENKVEISDDDYKEGVIEVYKANKILNRFGIDKYMSLLARNWCQVKYSDQIFAIGRIIKSGKRNKKGYYNKSKFDVVDGGTGYAVMMGVNNNREVYVFDQELNKWFRWSYISDNFIECSKDPIITSNNFAGIGTREINDNGVNAIKNIYNTTFIK